MPGPNYPEHKNDKRTLMAGTRQHFLKAVTKRMRAQRLCLGVWQKTIGTFKQAFLVLITSFFCVWSLALELKQGIISMHLKTTTSISNTVDIL